MDVQFSISREELANWVSTINQSFVFNGQLHDIFKCMKISGKAGSPVLQLEAADTISYVNLTLLKFKQPPKEDFSFLIFASMLDKILGSSKKDDVDFQVRDSMVTVRTESKYQLPVVSDVGYPVSKDRVELAYSSFSEVEFLAIMDTLVPFAAKEVVRPELAGVTVSDSVYVGTVGSYGVVHPREEDFLPNLTVFPPAIKFLRGCFKSIARENIQFSFDENSFYTKGPGFFYSSKLPSVKFPFDHLDRLLGLLEGMSYKAVVRGDLFADALRRVLLMEVDRFPYVKITVDPQSLTVSCQNEGYGGLAEERILLERFEAKKDFSTFEARLSLPSVDSCLRLFSNSAEIVGILFNSDVEPIIIRQKGSKYLFYTMAMRNV